MYISIVHGHHRVNRRAYLYRRMVYISSVVKIIITETQRLCTTCRTRNPIEERGSDIRTYKGLSVRMLEGVVSVPVNKDKRF